MRFPSGYGTVFKLSGKNRRRPYVAKVPIEYDNEGHLKYNVLGYFEKREQAINALAAYHTGIAIGGNEITLEQLYDEWSRQHFENISYSAKMQYVAAWKRLKILGKNKFTNLRTAHFQEVINDAKVKLKKGSLGKIKLLASMLYEYAIQNDICQKNYASYITLPKEEKTEKEVFTEAQIKKLWKNKDLPYVDTVLFMIYTGFRVGEMLKLTVNDVDFKNAVITGGLKTDAGKNRTVPIHDKILPFLMEWRKNKAGNTKLINITYGKYRQIFIEIMDILQIENKTPHSCRHTFATRMAQAGADVNALKNIIGHSNYSTTADVYTHMNISDLKKAISGLN